MWVKYAIVTDVNILMLLYIIVIVISLENKQTHMGTKERGSGENFLFH